MCVLSEHALAVGYWPHDHDDAVADLGDCSVSSNYADIVWMLNVGSSLALAALLIWEFLFSTINLLSQNVVY